MHRTQQDLLKFKTHLRDVYDKHWDGRKDGDDDGYAMSQVLVTASEDYLTNNLEPQKLAQSDRDEMMEDLRNVHGELRMDQVPYTYLFDDAVLKGMLDVIESCFEPCLLGNGHT